MNDDETPHIGSGWNASVIVLVVFLAALLYTLGQGFSGEPSPLTVTMSQAVTMNDGH